MHMADALLSAPVAAAMYTASAAAAVSVKQMKKEDALSPVPAAKRLPTMAVMSALVFAGQMINYTIPGTGSSGHLCGGLLLSAVLGPWAGFLSMIVILAIQALFFADGGLLALGANVWNMAFYGCFAGYFLIYRPIMQSKRLAGKPRARIALASVLGCVLTLQLGALSVVIETSLSGITELPFGAFLALMQPIHLAIGLVEGLITAAVLLFVYQARPELLQCTEGSAQGAQRISRKAALAILAAAAIVVGGGQARTPTGWNGRCSATKRPGIRPTWDLTRKTSACAARPPTQRQACRKRRRFYRITALQAATARPGRRCPGSSGARWSRAARRSLAWPGSWHGKSVRTGTPKHNDTKIRGKPKTAYRTFPYGRDMP